MSIGGASRPLEIVDADDKDSSFMVGGGSGGGGGKISRRSFRRNQASPYARPPLPSKQHDEGSSTWLSKLVFEPASRMLPALFSPRKNLPPPGPMQQILSQSIPSDRETGGETNQEDHPRTPILNSNECGTSTEIDTTIDHHDCADRLGSQSDDIGLAQIEEKMKQKLFSRDESDRLIELLRSRTPGLAGSDGGTARFGAETTEVPSSKKETMPLLEQRYKVESDIRLTQKASAVLNTDSVYDVGSSPTEIAKAYMRSRTTDQDSQTVVENSLAIDDGTASVLSLPSARKSPICWPGAVVQNEHGYFTPRAQSKKTALNYAPRTYYSGARSRSSFKLQSGTREASCLSPAERKQIATPTYVNNTAGKRSMPVFGDSYVSSGSIRQVRTKNVVSIAPEGATLSYSGERISGQSPNSESLKGFSSLFRENHQHGPSSIRKLQTIDISSKESKSFWEPTRVHPHSSGTARKILEHLDRTLPTPREKSRELQIAAGKFEFPQKFTQTMQDNGPTPSALDNHREGFQLGGDVATRNKHTLEAMAGSFTKKSLEKPNSEARKPSVPPQTLIKGSVQLANSTAQTPNQVGMVRLASSTAQTEAYQLPSSTIGSAVHGQVSSSIRFHAAMPMDVEKVKPSIDFTFPIQFTSNAPMEPPPTPTMTSSSSKVSRANEAARLPISSGSSTSVGAPSFRFGIQSTTQMATPSLSFGSHSGTSEEVIPTFTFGDSSPSEGSRLVFRFGHSNGTSFSSSSDSISQNADTSVPKFNFASDRSDRISFKVATKNAVCY